MESDCFFLSLMKNMKDNGLTVGSTGLVSTTITMGANTKVHG